MDSSGIMQGAAALIATINFQVALESRRTMVVSMTGMNGQRDLPSNTEEMPTE